MSNSEMDDPLEELARETDLTQGLVERLAELASSLKESDVPSGEITAGLQLLEEYDSLQGRRFNKDLEPEARQVAMPGCFAHLDQITRSRGERLEQVRAVRTSTLERASGDATTRRRLAIELEQLAQRTYEDLQYERDYPLSCLQATLPEDAAQRVRQAFDASRAETAELEGRIGSYLGRPLGGSVASRSSTAAGAPGGPVGSPCTCCDPVPVSLS